MSSVGRRRLCGRCIFQVSTVCLSLSTSTTAPSSGRKKTFGQSVKEGKLITRWLGCYNGSIIEMKNDTATVWRRGASLEGNKIV